MTSRTKRRLYRTGTTGTALVATGMWIGYYKAAFFLPGWTIQRARTYKPGGVA